MGLLSWNDSYSVGIQAMDAEHQELVVIVNELYDAMKQGRSKEVMNQVFTELLNYTKTHFANEESLMQKYQYPGLSDQEKEHLELLKNVKDKYEKFQSGAYLISVELLNFLKDWLLNHIMKSDKQYGVFLNSKGVK